MKNILKTYLLLLLSFIAFNISAQNEQPVKWKLSSNKISDCEYELQFAGTIEKHWHVYSLNLPGDDGPLPSKISFKKNKNFELIGKTTEGTPIKFYDTIFKMNVAYFENSVLFKQKIRLKDKSEVVIKGSYEYQACVDDKCIFPPATPFEFKCKGGENCIDKTAANLNDSVVAVDTADVLAKADTTPSNTSLINSSGSDNDDATIAGKAWWLIFLSGFIWGFAALFTPCVFPLIPMNVSFFLKSSKTASQGKINALIYMLSIVIIFVALGLSISSIWGAGALNTFATSAGFNLVIFILLIIFAISFLGAFEITLPSGLVNKIDKQSDRGGLVGIFFMALTLVVVSFSCTGPMVGNALLAATTSGSETGAFWAMFGFSTGLAIPFGLFAFFPSMLNSIPKSGGWLNTVKVVLGFLELALALKFASNVDLVYQLGIITREVFITLWIVIFGLMSVYLIGGFKTAHDSGTPHLSVTRIFFAIISFSVTVYILPGLWGAPLKLFSGILPPLEYSESPHGFGASSTESNPALFKSVDPEFEEYMDVNKNGIVHFTNDYEHAYAYAKKTGKPLLIDFTGHACANCRKTEDYIWPDHEVTKLLNNDVVLVSLYVDDKRALNPKDFKTVFWWGKERVITTIGDKFKYLEETLYKQSSQPLYVLVDNNEQVLIRPRGYKSGIQEYINWLDEGIKEFKNRKAE
jgi:thiol:disulfide interchange protein DsbD